MHGTMDKAFAGPGQRRAHRVPKAMVRCEALEARSLLSGFGGFADPMGMPRAAEFSSIGVGRRDGMFGAGSLGLGGAMMNPTLLLTAPLLVSGSGSTTPPSPSVMSSSSVQSALQTLQTDLKNDVAVGAQPSHESVGALQDTLEAVRKGTLTGTAAQTQIQSDQAAILTSMGLTQAQVTQIQSDQTALQTAISSATTTTSGTASTATSTSSNGTTATSTTSSGTTSAIQTAMQTLKTDLQNDTPSGAQPTYASIGAVQDDLDAIRKGTLTGTAAVTKVQTDTAGVLSSMGLTATQITQIQTDQQAVESAIAANSSSSTSSTSSTPSPGSIAATEATMQSVSAYLIGVPGVSSVGMRGMAMGGFGGSFAGGVAGGVGRGFGGGVGPGWRGGF
jgi:hypothetical protein